jgi:tetratricopeptide (TPR) repeat protein
MSKRPLQNGAEKSERDEAQLYREIIAELQQNGRTTRRSALEEATARATDPALAANLANLLVHCCFVERNYPDALAACRTWLDHAPNDPRARNTLLSVLSRLNRFDDVIDEAQSRLPSEPDNERIHSALAKAYTRLGRIEEARAAGNACLRLKDKAASGPAKDLSGVEVPPFDPANPDRNLIAFSLYGNAAPYTDGAVRNAIAAHYLYPEWRCRFYVDESVPKRVTDRLLNEGANVVRVGGLPAGRFGTFWRFLVADDEAVDRYLVRDCDACLNLRERAAVDEWLASGRHFHVMRDGMTHTEPMLAGMWGGVRGALPPIQEEIIAFCREAPLGRTVDQVFLRERAWPTVRQSVLAHDSQFSFRDSQPFPADPNPAGPRVGQAVTAPPIGWQDSQA